LLPTSFGVGRIRLIRGGKGPRSLAVRSDADRNAKPPGHNGWPEGTGVIPIEPFCVGFAPRFALRFPLGLSQWGQSIALVVYNAILCIRGKGLGFRGLGFWGTTDERREIGKSGRMTEAVGSWQLADGMGVGRWQSGDDYYGLDGQLRPYRRYNLWPPAIIATAFSISPITRGYPGPLPQSHRSRKPAKASIPEAGRGDPVFISWPI
jgi:hypothetical protein